MLSIELSQSDNRHIQDTREYGNLPAAAQSYVEIIELLVHCRIAYISVGPQREAVIMR
jgi:adenylosuccinate synthase